MAMKAIRDLYTITQLTKPAAQTGTFTSGALDTANANENMIAIVPGLWTDGLWAFKLQDSTDNTTFTDVSTSATAGIQVGSFANMNSTATAIVQKVSYIGPKRYVQVVGTATTATTGAVIGIQAITKPRKQAAP